MFKFKKIKVKKAQDTKPEPKKPFKKAEKSLGSFNLREVHKSKGFPEDIQKTDFFVKDTGSNLICEFIDPFSEEVVNTSLNFLKCSIKTKDPLTLEGVINLNPTGNSDFGDFQKCKPFKILKGKAYLA